MISPTEKDKSDFAVHYLTANTPLYIVRKMREERFVINLVIAESSESISAEAKKLLSIYDGCPTSAGTIYAYIIALLIKSDIAELNELAKLNSSIKWFNDIIGYAIKSAVPAKVTSIDMTRLVKNNAIINGISSTTVMTNEGSK